MRRATEFGRIVRKYRSKAGVRTKDMAEALGVSVSYLSAMETGAKPLTDRFVERVIDYFRGLNIDTQEDLVAAADRTKSRIVLDFDDVQKDSREVIAAFARRFSNASPQEKEEQIRVLRELLEKAFEEKHDDHGKTVRD